MSRVAVLGLGAMGSRIAQRLLAAGHELTVWNRTQAATSVLREQGAHVGDSPRAAAARAQVVISVVSDDLASRSVWLDPAQGALEGLRPEAVATETSTLSPAWCMELAGRVAARGASFLDAPVVGSRPQADAGQLVYLVGGAPDTLAQVAEILQCAGALHHVGPHGAGAALKLVVNALFSIQVAALGELLGLARRAQLDVVRAIEVLGTLAVTSPAAKGALASMQARRFEPMFPVALVEKDLRYALELASTGGADTPLTALVHGVFARAALQGCAGENITAAAKMFE